MKELSERAKSRLIVLSSNCQTFNNLTNDNPNIGYFLVPFPFHSEDSPNHVQDKYLEYLNKQKQNWNEAHLRNGTYLYDFLIESGNEDHTFIFAYKIWKWLTNKLNFLQIEFEIFDGKNTDKDANELYFKHIEKLLAKS